MNNINQIYNILLRRYIYSEFTPNYNDVVIRNLFVIVIVIVIV